MRIDLSGADPNDPAVKALLEELDQTLAENPLQGYNHPLLPKRHLKQIEFNAIKTPTLGTKAIIAGNRTGKTRGGLADDVLQAVRPEYVPAHLEMCKKWQPPFHCWIGAPKYSKHEDTILPTLRMLIPKRELLEESFDKSYKAQSRILRLVSGSTFSFKTYDQDLDAWASAEVHRIHWDEEPNGENSRALRSEARARLLSTGGDELITMSPLLGFSWVNDDVWEMRHEDPKIFVVQMGMADNPWLSKEAIADFERGLTKEEIRMRVHGEFVHLGGLFYDEFRERLHVVAPPTPERLRSMDVVVAIDPGRNRTGVTWTAFDKDNSAIVFAEHNPREAIVPEVAAEIRRRNTLWGLTGRREPVYVIDPSARGTSPINADQVEAAYAREGIYCEPGQNSRAAGILEVKRRLQARDARGFPAPTLVFSEECPQAITQHEKYRRDPRANDEWQAVPQNDQVRFDLCDCVRYSVMSRTWELPFEPPTRPPAFQANYQPPYSQERFLEPAAPMGKYT